MRGAKPGERRGGRTKATPNKKSADLKQRAEALKIDPFELLLRFGNGDWKALGYDSRTKTAYTATGMPYEVDEISVQDRIAALKDCCQYIYPKRKAIEVSNSNPFLSGEEKITVDLRWADETDSEVEEEDAAAKED